MESALDTEVATQPACGPGRRPLSAQFSLSPFLVLLSSGHTGLGVRDASDVPVIQAQQTATKVRPEAPGGLEVAHQGREVYGVVSGGGTEAEAGFAPVEDALAEEDVAAALLAPAPPLRPASEEAPVAPADVIAAAPEAEATLAPVTLSSDRAPEVVVEPLVVAAVEPTNEPGLASPLSAPAVVDDAPATEEPDALSEWVQGLSPRQAPTPTVRPKRVASLAPVATPEPRAAALSSNIQIQLGAFRSEDIAAEQWKLLKSRNGDLLSGKGRVITPVVSGGQRLYRLRAGPFTKIQEASALCRAMQSRGEACIVAKKR